MFKRPKGAAFVPPVEVSRLPLNLRRTSLVTRQPDLAAQGAADYYERLDGARPSPTLLPQRAQFQQWKSNMLTDGANRPKHAPWDRSATLIGRAFEASGVPQSTVHRVKPPPVTYEAARAALDYGGSFPEPPEDLDPPEIVTRDAPAYGRPLLPPPDAFVTTMEAVGERGEVRRNGACRRALFEAAAVQDRVRNMIRGGR